MGLMKCPECGKSYYMDKGAEEFFVCGNCGYPNHSTAADDNEYDNTYEESTPTQQTNNVSPAPTNNDSRNLELLVELQRKQLEKIDSIRSMVLFFTVLTCISIAFTIIGYMTMFS